MVASAFSVEPSSAVASGKVLPPSYAASVPLPVSLASLAAGGEPSLESEDPHPIAQRPITTGQKLLITESLSTVDELTPAPRTVTRKQLACYKKDAATERNGSCRPTMSSGLGAIEIPSLASQVLERGNEALVDLS
jgi:hypothetical protein